MEQNLNNSFSLRIKNYNNIFDTKEMPFWMYSEVIDKFMTMLGNVDEYTEYHCFRVAILTKLFLECAVQCEINEEINNLDINKIKEIVYGAYVHDIGKSQVKNYVINKKGDLTPEEWEELKSHPANGAFLFLGPGYETIREVILCHHERWDGLGYPMMYSKEQIPLGARIVCLVDSFDAMTDKRPYQNNNPLEIEEAIKEIEMFSEKQFDPGLIPIFKKMVESENFKLFWKNRKDKEYLKDTATTIKYWIFNSLSIEEQLRNEEKNIAVMKKILNIN